MVTALRLALTGLVLGVVSVAGCTASSSGGLPVAAAPAAGGTGGTSTAPAAFVNPAWQEPLFAPSYLWERMAPVTPLADWFNARPWLLDRSTWASYVRSAEAPGRDQLGAFGVGNGRVFGMVGLSYPLNTIHGMCGPTYAGDFFGDFSVGVELNPRTVQLQEEWLWKPRRAAAAITKARGAELELYTVDVAPPGVDAIVRVVIVRNPTSQTQADVRVVTRMFGTVVAEGGKLVQTRGGHKLTIGATGGLGTSVLGSNLRVALGSIPPMEERAAMVYCAFSADEASRLATIAQVEALDADRHLEATRGHWASFFAEGVELTMTDPKVQDFIEDMTATCAVQIAENGCASPMSRYTSTWMRDQEGAHRLFLRTGRPEPVRRMLDSYYRTSILVGGIFNSMPADLDVTRAGQAPDWMTAGFFQNGPDRFATEAPSYIPIELYDYYAATGDDTILREQYDFARAAVLRQEVSPEGLMRFNGDEPFRWVLMMATGLYEPEFRGWSSNSAFLYVAAAERMAKVAALLGKPQDAALFQQKADFVRQATEKTFWLPQQGFYDVCRLFYGNINVLKPFEDISLLPMRIGYASPRDARLRQNLLATKDLLGRSDGLIWSNPLVAGVMGTDGHVPGYYLQNLTMIDHPDAEKTFNGIGRFAQVTGEIAEGHLAARRGVIMLQYAPDGQSVPDTTARYRPWEGGIVAEAVLQYLIGEDRDAASGRVALTPHMPNGWGVLEARGLECGGRPYDLEVRDFQNRRLERVTNRSSRPLAVDLGASVTGFSIGQVRLDGKPIQQPWVDAEFGRLSFRIQRTLAPGESVDLDFDYVR